ncbi:PREDICTED: uncharacterized protein LOC106120713 [Papilio xuthus]|uniref:Uncharacterized protein LOC106120713 n=1 Tax=Papilio xuthus TaxID=66420 RepID=A0AAJ6ZFF7_PAPXU|nr:PREDICTED: uncharacterized protein LOC106120713 [Papilio xuthus]
MVRGAVLVVTLALAWVCNSQASVLVPTYVLPPDSFVRDQRSLASSAPHDSLPADSQRTVKRLVGGHMKIKHDKEYGASKNYIGYEGKTESGKFAGVYVADPSGGTVGWNQGIWDDGMLMSSAGEGKDAGKVKEDDEEKKTLSDQVAEGKYGLIQNEIFAKAPKRPGIVSYEPDTETRTKDNLQSLGGLKKDEIWLAEDHLLVLKGGSFPERTKDTGVKPWPPIDSYEAPRRQVKLPQKPKVPPPFPVRLSDDGPLVFLTPNGSVPASLFPPFPTGEGDGPLPPPPFLFTAGAPYPSGENQRNSTTGQAPLPIPPFPFLPGNASEGPYPFPPSMNGSFPEGFPPGAAFLPPPSNQTDLYDEDDPSIYYPPPYNFSYHSEYNNSVPAGPLVPGIILPPPPDFFAPLDETTTTEVVYTKRPATTSPHSRPKYHRKQSTTPSVVYRRKYKTRPTTTTESTRTTEDQTTFTTVPPTEIMTTLKERTPQRVVTTPPRNPIRVQNLPDDVTYRPKTEKPVYKSRTKLTSKPLSVSVLYDYPEQIYNKKPPATSESPYIIYRLSEKTPNAIQDDIVTSTQVPLRAYYSDDQNDGIPATKLQPVYRRKPSQNAVASFYFYDEQPKTSPAPETYFDGRNYYKTVPSNPVQQPQQPSVNTQNGYSPVVDVSYGAIDDSDGLFLWPQKQGPRILTQEYFSVQKPRPQPVYVQQPKQNPSTFYQEIGDIRQTIDLFTTKRPKAQAPRNINKQKHGTPRPVYQFSYQTNPRPEQLAFRAPKLDPEPFRPMVSYSKPFNIENEFNAITPSVSPVYHQQYLVENVPVTTETPTPSRYYAKANPTQEIYDEAQRNKEANQNRNQIPVQTGKPAPIHQVNRYPSTTPNPISNGYYTKQDETYFDDITRNSFDIFGQKVEDGAHDVNGLAVTPPLETVRTPVNNNINLQYDYEIVQSPRPTNPPSLEGDILVNYRPQRPQINPNSEPIAINPSAQLVQPPKPPSLLDDTRVNDKYPRPSINPDSEFIPIPNPNYRKAAQYASELDDLNATPAPPSLQGDTDVNYKNPRPSIEPEAEWIPPAGTDEGRRGAFVSYRLPGEGAHVYFLTPQASQAVQAAHDRRRPPGYGR